MHSVMRKKCTDKCNRATRNFSSRVSVSIFCPYASRGITPSFQRFPVIPSGPKNLSLTRYRKMNPSDPPISFPWNIVDMHFQYGFEFLPVRNRTLSLVAVAERAVGTRGTAAGAKAAAEPKRARVARAVTFMVNNWISNNND